MAIFAIGEMESQMAGKMKTVWKLQTLEMLAIGMMPHATTGYFITSARNRLPKMSKKPPGLDLMILTAHKL